MVEVEKELVASIRSCPVSISYAGVLFTDARVRDMLCVKCLSEDMAHTQPVGVGEATMLAQH